MLPPPVCLATYILFAQAAERNQFETMASWPDPINESAIVVVHVQCSQKVSPGNSIDSHGHTWDYGLTEVGTKAIFGILELLGKQPVFFRQVVQKR